MVKIQIDIPKEQNELLTEYNDRLAFSKAKSIVIMLGEMLNFTKHNWEDILLGKRKLLVEENSDDIEDWQNIRTYDFKGEVTDSLDNVIISDNYSSMPENIITSDICFSTQENSTYTINNEDINIKDNNK